MDEYAKYIKEEEKKTGKILVKGDKAGKYFELDNAGTTIINYSFNFKYGKYYTDYFTNKFGDTFLFS